MFGQLAIFFAICCLAFADLEFRTNQHQLYSNLFNGDYHKLVRPAKQVNVSLFVGTVALLDVDEDQNLIKTMIFHGLKWTDDRLVWNPEEYNGVSHISASTDDLWVPDIRILNDATQTNPGAFNDHEHGYAWLFSNGTVFHTAEKIALIPLKAEGQDVSIRYCSWSFPREELLLKGDRIGEAFESLNPKWHVSNGKYEDGDLHAACCVRPFAMVQLHFKVDKHE